MEQNNNNDGIWVLLLIGLLFALMLAALATAIPASGDNGDTLPQQLAYPAPDKRPTEIQPPCGHKTCKEVELHYYLPWVAQ